MPKATDAFILKHGLAINLSLNSSHSRTQREVLLSVSLFILRRLSLLTKLLIPLVWSWSVSPCLACGAKL